MKYLVSFPINHKVRKKIEGLTPTIKEKLSHEQSQQIDFLDSTNYHLTVGYLDKIEDNSIDDLNEVVQKTADKQTKFNCKLNKLYIEESDYVPQIIAAKVKTKTNRIKYVRRDLIRFLKSRNFKHADEKWNPHISLGWIKTSEIDLPKISNIKLEALDWEINKLKLLRIESIQSGYSYDVISEYSL